MSLQGCAGYAQARFETATTAVRGATGLRSQALQLLGPASEAMALQFLTAARRKARLNDYRTIRRSGYHFVDKIMRKLKGLDALADPSGSANALASRGARRGRRSASFPFWRLASVSFSRHRTRQMRSKSAGKATACSSASRSPRRTKFRHLVQQAPRRTS